MLPCIDKALHHFTGVALQTNYQGEAGPYPSQELQGPGQCLAYKGSSIKAERRIIWWDRAQVFREEMRVREREGTTERICPKAGNTWLPSGATLRPWS